jgi:phthiocerol/phenolphthiocerol synthesis type-I polyketide synthase D
MMTPLSSAAPRDPIAIVGVACRFPGCPDAAAFWQLLERGGRASGGRPGAAAGAPAPGTLLLDDVAGFDAEFFGITPSEAEAMDPQQRLLLELTAHALDDANIPHRGLAGSNAGVYVGLSSHDYSVLLWNGGATPKAITGTANCMAANRVSYWLDLHGPSLVVDTGCSSALAAVHLAARALSHGDISCAIVGAASVLLLPAVTEMLQAAGMIAPDGCCRAFDDGAAGYVRAEGAGVVVLKRLTDVTDRDRVYAVIAGSAMNHSGASNGMTSPRPSALRDVMETAWRDAGVDPGDLQYVEAMGVGSRVADAIELNALTAALGHGGSGRRLVGSVKTNVGHTEAASGLAALLKVTLALSNGIIPAHLNLRDPNRLAGCAAQVDIPSAPRPWPGEDGAGCAGVSAFGFGGVNLHVVLRPAPRRSAHDPSAVSGWSPGLLNMSARSGPALASLARAYAGMLREPRADVPAICATASRCRTHYSHRLAVHGETAADLARGLEAWLETGDGGEREGVVRWSAAISFECADPFDHPTRASERGTVEHSAYAAQRARCRAVFARCGLDRTRVAPQLDFFAAQMSEVAWWRHVGVTPAALSWSGLGLLAAAWAADAADLETLCAVLLEHAAGTGTAAMVRLAEAVRGVVPAARVRGCTLVFSPHAADEHGATGDLLLGRLYVRGVPIRWDRCFDGVIRSARLPPYPFDRRRYWFDDRQDRTRQPSNGEPASSSAAERQLCGVLDELGY